ncbi:ALK and LTK ligand 1 [Varanus komodoensis]|uniref:ALK and LTK ligand 1 n=1 Tax=Varanus komodoensis TaxID=61221 RepID=UPI001CF7AB1B|nr:ALK and LTK ligand 1 [Varanus komodoensis]XP_044280130.1 ALK and LTK ligand 1 [Varanus komodoensis]
MPGAKPCRRQHRHRRGSHALPALLFFLLLASARTSRVEGASVKSKTRDLQISAGDRKMLLELLLKVLGDSSSHQAPSHLLGAERVIARRYTNGGALYASPAVDQEGRTTSSSASSSRERVAGHAPRFISSSRHSEVFPRDSNLKDKFIKHFTGPVTFSAECSKHFHRLYHNTRDCSTPAYYKRCARLLTRLAMSPLCTQP